MLKWPRKSHRRRARERQRERATRTSTSKETFIVDATVSTFTRVGDTRPRHPRRHHVRDDGPPFYDEQTTRKFRENNSADNAAKVFPAYTHMK